MTRLVSSAGSALLDPGPGRRSLSARRPGACPVQVAGLRRLWEAR